MCAMKSQQLRDAVSRRVRTNDVERGCEQLTTGNCCVMYALVSPIVDVLDSPIVDVLVFPAVVILVYCVMIASETLSMRGSCHGDYPSEGQ